MTTYFLLRFLHIIGATVLLCGLPYVLAFGLLFDLALVFGSTALAPLFRVPAGWLFALGCIGLVKDAAYLLFVYRRKAPIRLGGWAVNLPTPRMTALQILVGVVDICLIAAILYLLLPPTAGIAFLPFVAVYLASIIVGVLKTGPPVAERLGRHEHGRESARGLGVEEAEARYRREGLVLSESGKTVGLFALLDDDKLQRTVF